MLKMDSRKFSLIGIRTDSGYLNEDTEGMPMQTLHTQSRGQVEKMRGGEGQSEAKLCPGDSLVGTEEHHL